MGRSAGQPKHSPLYEGCMLASSTEEWDEESAKWHRREFPEHTSLFAMAEMSYSEYAGERPDPDDYMPAWTEEEATHYQMYETCSEGTPISPVMVDPEALARWLVDNNANTFADFTADFDSWMKIILGDDALFIMRPGGISGVEIC